MNNDIKKAIVRITFKDGSNNRAIKGTGVIVSLPDEDRDAILTVYHVIENFNGRNEDIIIDTDYEGADEKAFNAVGVLYNKSNKEDLDVAVIYVNKLKWFSKKDNMVMAKDFPTDENYDIKLAGFPNLIEKERLDLPYLPIHVAMEHFERPRIMLPLKHMFATPNRDFGEVVVGMSGSPVYCQANNKTYLLGITKKIPTSEECPYYIFHAWHIGWYLDKIKELYECYIPLHEELIPSKNVIYSSGINKVYNIPKFDDYFIGREDKFRLIEAKFLNTKEKFSIQALVGMGGVGKTTLARKYANDKKEQYDLIWWFNAEDKTVLKSEYIQLAKALGINILDSNDISTIRYNIDIKLNQFEKCLFVFDNVEDYDDIKSYVGSQAHVLVTSRSRKLMGIQKRNIVDIDVLNDEEGIKFILERLELEPSVQNEASAKELAFELGFLPLAMEQSVAYIENDPSMNLNKYLELYREYSKVGHLYSYFDEHDIPENYHHKLTVTWKITFDKIKSSNPVVISFMNLCALLSPENIPYFLFENNAQYLADVFHFTNEEKSNIYNTIKNIFIKYLYKYSIIQWNTENSTIRMHRLVQCIIRADLERNNLLEIFEEHIVRVLENSFEFNEEESSSWAICKSIYSHVSYILEQKKTYDPKIMIYYSSLFHKLSSYAYYVLSPEEAKEYLLKGMQIDDEIYPNNDLVRELNLNNLGNLLERLEETDEAKVVLEECLKLNRKNHTPPNSAISTTLNNMGLLDLKTGNYEEAKIKFNEALNMDITLFGEYSEDVFTDLHNLGITETHLKNYSSAKDFFEKAIEAGERCFNTNSPKMAAVYKNLSPVLIRLGDNQSAVSKLEESLRIYKQLYGRNSIKIVHELFLFAVIMQSIDIEAAIKRYEEAFEILENISEVNDEDLIEHMEQLGRLYLKLERYGDARDIFTKAYDIVEKYYPNDVTVITKYLNYLGKVSFDLKDFEDCILRLEKIVSFPENQDTNNPYFIEDMESLGSLYLKTDNQSKAIKQYEKLISITEGLEPIDYHAVLKYLRVNLHLLINQGRYDEALEKGNIALLLSNRLHGKLAIDNCVILNNIGYIYILKGDPEEAKIKYELAINIIEHNKTDLSGIGIDIAQVYLSMGELLEGENNLSDAKSNYEKALQVSLNKQTDMKKVVECYEALAQLSTKEKSFEEVFEIYKNILMIDKQVYGKINENVALDLKIIIGALVKAKRLGDSIPFIEERMSILEVLYGKEDSKYIELKDMLLKIKEKLKPV